MKPSVLRFVVFVLASAPAACAPQRPVGYRSALAAGDRALLAGRIREAAEAYDRAALETRRALDRDEALYRAAQAWLRAGDVSTALARFDWLAAHSSMDHRGARAALEAARIRLELGQVARAEEEVLALARRAPHSGPARRGIELVLLARDQRDPSGASALDWIDAVFPSLVGTVLEPSLAFQRARRLERLGRSVEAVAAYETLLALPYPGNTHWDDGGLAYAQLLVRLNRPAEAVSVIDRVLAVREVSVLTPGSYERPRFAELQLFRARLLRDRLHDRAAAAEAFHRLYTDYPFSRLRDDALREEAEVYLQMNQQARACELFAQLAREFPCTRHGRYALVQGRTCGYTPPEHRACRHSANRLED